MSLCERETPDKEILMEPTVSKIGNALVRDNIIVLSEVVVSGWDRLKILFGWRLRVKSVIPVWFDDEMGIDHKLGTCEAWLYNPRARARPMAALESKGQP